MTAKACAFARLRAKKVLSVPFVLIEDIYGSKSANSGRKLFVRERFASVASALKSNRQRAQLLTHLRNVGFDHVKYSQFVMLGGERTPARSASNAKAASYISAIATVVSLF